MRNFLIFLFFFGNFKFEQEKSTTLSITINSIQIKSIQVIFIKILKTKVIIYLYLFHYFTSLSKNNHLKIQPKILPTFSINKLFFDCLNNHNNISTNNFISLPLLLLFLTFLLLLLTFICSKDNS